MSNNAPTNTAGAIGRAQNRVAAARKPEATIKAYITKMDSEIAKALPSVITPERFTRIVMSAVSTTPQLAETTPQSFLGAMMTAAQLGMEPNTPLGQAYLLPYKNHGKLECQFQLGYKGLIDLAYRSGEVTIIQAHEVCENDDFTYAFGIVACHDGKVYWYSSAKAKPFLPSLIDDKVDKYRSPPYSKTIQKAFEQALNDAVDAYGVEWRELK